MNAKQQLECIGQQLGVRQLSDWYRVSLSQFERRGGASLIKAHNSLCDVLRNVYPEHQWVPGQFRATKTYRKWSDVNEQRQFLNSIAPALGISDIQDWAKVKRKHIIKLGGLGFLHQHATLAEALTAAFPGHDWKRLTATAPQRAPPGHWDNIQNLISLIERAEKHLSIQKPDDWYSVTLTDLHELGLPRSINRTKLADLLHVKYPDHKWEKIYLLRGRYAQQKRLEKAISSLFPNVELKINARKEAQLINPETGCYLELDIFIPSLKLAFEFQEGHHYGTVNHVYTPLDEVKARDTQKKELAAANNISLISIPNWWDGSKESLIATIKEARPDLLTEVESVGQAIPSEMPPNFARKQVIYNVEGLGEPTTACFLTKESIDPTNWWLFEKYDGLRGFWNPEKKAMYSRAGKKFALPKEIIDGMPSDLFLDGELWFGRDTFQEALKLSSRSDNMSINWSKFKFMVFDLPKHPGSYKERYETLEKNLSESACKYIEVAKKEICSGIEHLERFLQDILDNGGEGIILRDPLAPYQPGRSAGYLKHKKFRDCEAKVIGQAGVHQWECELPNGVRFYAQPGTTEFVKRCNLQSGDIVSFKHRGFLLASGKPKLPSIYRIRTDLSWDDVIRNWQERTYTPNVLPVRRTEPRARPPGYWRDPANRRLFFIEVAKSMGFDPLSAHNWNVITKEQILKYGGAGLLSATPGGSHRKALDSAFPDIQFSWRLQ